MMRILAIAAGLAFIVAILLSMPLGRALARRVGLGWIAKGGAPREDREFLLQLCGNDRSKATELLEAERQKFSELSEAQLYRRVIRSQIRQREAATRDEH
jgi:hypothetical protein